MIHRTLLAIGLAAVALVASAQPATPEQRAGVAPNDEFGTLHLATRLGSFRLMDGEGRVEFTFVGTVLISQLQGQYQVTGNVRREHEGRGRVVLSGTGRIVATGKFRAIQWFGRDMRLVWYGRGLAQLAGEFDRNLNTGEFWYEDPSIKGPWPTQGTITVMVPPQMANPNIQPRERRRPPRNPS